MDCPRCGTEIQGGRCPVCKYTVPTMRDDSSDLVSVLKSLATGIAVISFVLYLLLNTGLLIWSMDIIIPETLAFEGYEWINSIFITIPFPVIVGYVEGSWFTAYYLFLVGAVLFSLIYIFYSSGSSIISYLKNLVKGKIDELEKNDSHTSSPFMRLITIFTALLFFSFTYILLIEYFGPGMDTPERPPEIWKNIYNLLRASVWEEVMMRMVLIGMPMAIYGAVKGKGKTLKYLLGGFGTKEKLAIYLVVLSSIAFGLAHLPGWDIYKIPQTLIPGFAFGYLFIKDGIHSAILLHFFWNFMNVPNDLIDISGIGAFISLLTFFWILVGIYYTYAYIQKFTDWLEKDPKEKYGETLPKKKEKQEEPLAPPEPEDHTAGVSIGYMCKNCGFNRATYTDKGKLKCKRCGTKSDPKSPEAQQRENMFKRNNWPPS